MWRYHCPQTFDPKYAKWAKLGALSLRWKLKVFLFQWLKNQLVEYHYTLLRRWKRKENGNKGPGISIRGSISISISRIRISIRSLAVKYAVYIIPFCCFQFANFHFPSFVFSTFSLKNKAGLERTAFDYKSHEAWRMFQTEHNFKRGLLQAVLLVFNRQWYIDHTPVRVCNWYIDGWLIDLLSLFDENFSASQFLFVECIICP